MRNQFPGTCYRCGGRVKAGEGHFERFSAGHRKKYPKAPYTMKWLTQHSECAIKYRGTDVSIFTEKGELV